MKAANSSMRLVNPRSPTFSVFIAAVVVLAAFVFPACASLRHAEASRPSEVGQTEVFLKQAGFGQLEVETPEQLNTARNLPTYEIRHYPAQDGDVYWYYDPGNCECVFVGDEAAYQQYQGLTQQKNDIAEYEAESQQQEAASLNLLSPTFFPAPVFFLAAGTVVVAGSGGHHVPTGGGHSSGGPVSTGGGPPVSGPTRGFGGGFGNGFGGMGSHGGHH